MIMGAWGLGRKRLPYDAEVNYLESTGTQWIDTGIIGSNLIIIVADLQLMNLGASKAIFGCFGGTSRSLYAYQAGSTNTGKWQFGFQNVYNTGTTDTNRHMIVIDASSAKIDGIPVISYSAGAFSTPYTLLLFNMHNDSGGIYTADSMRVFGFEIINNGVLVRDFQPVRFTNEQGVSEGAMFDRANPTVGMNPDGSPRTDGLYRNRGTGAFLWAEKQ